jgi:hypothetical protein
MRAVLGLLEELVATLSEVFWMVLALAEASAATSPRADQAREEEETSVRVAAVLREEAEVSPEVGRRGAVSSAMAESDRVRAVARTENLKAVFMMGSSSTRVENDGRVQTVSGGKWKRIPE